MNEQQMKELIAKRLIVIRGDATREETANAIGISVSALQMYENGQRIPKDSIKIRIANHYKKTVQEIFFDDEPHETCCCQNEQFVSSERKEVG